MQRRHLLQHALSLPLAVSSLSLRAAPSAPARLLVVFLRGAYDCASLLVPITSSDYAAMRPSIAIGPPGSGDNKAALPLTADWGLAPVLRDSMLPLWQRGQLAFVPFAGTDDLSRSHFETQDSIELGLPLQGPRSFDSGFMNRLAGVLDAHDAIAFTDQLPLVFRGPASVPNLALNGAGRGGLDAGQAARIAAMYQGSPLAGPVDEGFAVRRDAARELGGTQSGGMQGEMAAASRNAITAKGFEGEARRIARLMRERYRLGFVDVGGWDTHVGQGGASGVLANRLGELGQGLAAFGEEIGPAWDQTVVVVISEFGRTFRENGNRGTDHGHGTVYWLLGGAVRGGRIVGEQVPVNAANLFQNRDYPVLNEYRAVLGGLFVRLYGLSPAQLQRVFPGAAPRDLGLV